MESRFAATIRNHLHVLLIVPLVVIVMTWPTFPLLFETDDYWFHTRHVDLWYRMWEAWRLERVLAGQAQLFDTTTIFHPHGVSLAFQHISLPHAFLFLVLVKFIPADSAYNLLFLLILCFNAYCAYVLILHLLHEKWSALYGAIVVAVCIPFISGSTSPDITMIGTIPLTIYFFHRYVMDGRRIFAALAGLCAGVTAFIGVYTFVFILISVGIIAVFLACSRWKILSILRGLLLFTIVCVSISSFRFYPMIVDASVLKEGLETHLHIVRSNDVFECCAFTANPFTQILFRELFPILPDSTFDSLPLGRSSAYLGYINLFFLLCALLHKPLWRRLAPWLATLACFAILRLGHFLTINGQEYRNILLPEHYLSEWFPAIFGNIHDQRHYQFAVVVLLAILASAGLARLIRSKSPLVRATVVLISALILGIEFYIPPSGNTVERAKMAYIDWLSTETDSSIKLINLPQGIRNALYYLFLQTFNDYPLAFGHSSRNPESARTYIRRNALLNAWDENRSSHCLPHLKRAYVSALDQLLADGFTHVVVHYWLFGDQFINHSFWNVPASYDDGMVRVYRLRDLRLSCESRKIELSPIKHFADSPSAIPGRRSSIISFHPSESIDEDLFAYLASLFSDWRSLAHLYLDNGNPAIQSAGMSIPDLESFARDNQMIYLIYNMRDLDSAVLPSLLTFERFNLCQREEHEDGSVIEHYLSRDFSCALVNSSQPLQVDYDNGARLVNATLEITQNQLTLQAMWSGLPREPHSVSLQVFDDEGAKVLGQDSTIGHVSLARHHADISKLPPGNYVVKLIVYDFNTRVSVSGVATGTSTRFERELEIATIDRA